MKTLADIAQRFLNCSGHMPEFTTPYEVPEVRELITFFCDEGRADVWVDDYNAHINEIWAKRDEIESMNMREVFTYLTILIDGERIWGLLESGIKDGTVDRLLARYLELVREGENSAARS